MQLEREYLANCIKVIKDNITFYEKEIAIMSAEIKEMYERYRDNDPEIFVELANTITMNENMKLFLKKNQRALIKPYFGKIDIVSEKGKQEQFYIGKGGVMKDNTTILVVDWRAPIASIYYENGLGPCEYEVPTVGKIPVHLNQKRTFEIDGETLIDYYDSEVVANDELLTKYLVKNKEAVLGEIIATIQKDQNAIIRKSPHKNIIVQGVAGSGKTTVAMHRISFILYNYTKKFKPEDFYIVGSNRILLNYITSVLPDLDVHGIKQMTMEELFTRLLYEDWKPKKFKIVACPMEALQKGTLTWFKKLENYCNNLEQQIIPTHPILFQEIVLLSTEKIEDYIKDNPNVSVQSKINMLNARVIAKLQNEITGQDLTYTKERKRELIKEYTGLFGPKKWKHSIYHIYDDFLRINKLESIHAENKLDVYDLAALAYLYKRLKETDPIKEAGHIVVDEAQDYGMMAYTVLKFCIPTCTWTIMGDISQNIKFGSGLYDWKELKNLILKDDEEGFEILSKSYRNTIEISEFAQSILDKGSISGYKIEPIIRHGKNVSVSYADKESDKITEAIKYINNWKEYGYDTIAVICRTKEKALYVTDLLSKYIHIEENDLEKVEFKNGVLVFPLEYTKGLEFDTALIFDPTLEDYPLDAGHARMLYVAATRALHELAIVCGKNITELIS